MRSCPLIVDSSFCRGNKRITAPMGKQYHIFEKILFHFIDERAFVCYNLSTKSKEGDFWSGE